MKIRMFTLPNILTLCNLLCGCAAIYYCVALGDLATAFLLMVAAAIFDFSDGFAARLTGQYSDLGKQLDSLADMVSFGVLPAAILYTVSVSSAAALIPPIVHLITVSVALFSALRLARFNIDPTQSEEFRGLPTPACALFAGSLGWLFSRGLFTVHPFAIIAVSVLLSYLLVCPLRMFALKFSDWSWKNNRVRYLFVSASLLSLLIWKIAAIPFIITGYILVSLAISALCSGKGSRGASGHRIPE